MMAVGLAVLVTSLGRVIQVSYEDEPRPWQMWIILGQCPREVYARVMESGLYASGAPAFWIMTVDCDVYPAEVAPAQLRCLRGTGRGGSIVAAVR